MSLQLISSDDLLARADGELEWVLYPLLVRGSSMMVYARQGTGKSSAMFQLAHSFITGDPWLGFEVRARGPVIYLQVDMGEQETIRLVQRAEAAGYDMHGQLYMSYPAAGDETISFDILQDSDLADFTDLCAQVKPIAVIVDTIHDSYEHQDKYKDVNSLARKVHKRFKGAIGRDAALIFLNHERKGLPKKVKEAGEDHDSFMGGQAWEGIVSASVKFERRESKRAKMILRKVRLEDKPFETLELEITKHGFFEPIKDHKMLLLTWPDYLSAKERAEEIARIKTKQDVFRRISAISGSALATVRKFENDHKELSYPWKKYLTDAT